MKKILLIEIILLVGGIYVCYFYPFKLPHYVQIIVSIGCIVLAARMTIYTLSEIKRTANIETSIQTFVWMAQQLRNWTDQSHDEKNLKRILRKEYKLDVPERINNYATYSFSVGEGYTVKVAYTISSKRLSSCSLYLGETQIAIYTPFSYSIYWVDTEEYEILKEEELNAFIFPPHY